MKCDIKHKKEDKAALAAVLDWVGAMVLALVLLAVVFTLLFRHVGVDGNSMLPTLQNGDRLLLSSTTDEFLAGDIVVIDRYTQEPLIKRVIAVGGDKVEILPDGTLLINDRVAQEPYIQGVTVMRDWTEARVIPEGYLFVMGDNRTDSKDSRMNEVGVVSVKDVVGKAVFRLWPLTSFGSIYYNLESNVS